MASVTSIVPFILLNYQVMSAVAFDPHGSVPFLPLGLVFDKFLEVVSSNPLLRLCVVYAFVVPLFWHRGKEGSTAIDLGRKGESTALPLRGVMLGYNALMSVFSFVCFVNIAIVLSRNERIHASRTCHAFANDALFVSTVRWFYWSKFVEFLDTVFLILRAKPVSWLHYLHHVGAAVNMCIANHTSTEAGYIFCFLNGFVHTVMYAYYGAALVGSGRLDFVRPFITGGQIIQFFIGFSLLWSYKDVPCFRSDPGEMLAWWYTYIYVGSVLALFFWFFLDSYVCGKTKEARDAKAKTS